MGGTAVLMLAQGAEGAEGEGRLQAFAGIAPWECEKAEGTKSLQSHSNARNTKCADCRD